MLEIDASCADETLTLRRLAENNFELAFKCARCGHRQSLDIRQLIRQHGGETRLRYLQRTVRCELCD